MREVTVLSNAKSRATVLYECRVCHRALEAVVDVKRGDGGGAGGRPQRTRHDPVAYHASLRRPRPPTSAPAEPDKADAQRRAVPLARPIRPAPRVRVTRAR